MKKAIKAAIRRSRIYAQKAAAGTGLTVGAVAVQAQQTIPTWAGELMTDGAALAVLIVAAGGAAYATIQGSMVALVFVKRILGKIGLGK